MKTFIKSITLFVAMSATAISAVAAQKTQFHSVYTDLQKDCVVISASDDTSEIDFYEAQCKSFGGYQLTIKGGDIRYHPTLAFGGKDIAIKAPMGFHDTASTKIEWVYGLTADQYKIGTLEWKGLIYRLSQTSEDGESDLEVLYAVRLDGEKTCLIGTAQNNVKARELVYNSKPGCR